MRWNLIDKFIEFEPGKRAVAVKANTLAEDHLRDLHPDYPIVPNTLLIEGMAQTAGILVGESRQFTEKVILAKITRATFFRVVLPGETVRFEAIIDSLNDVGASITGKAVMFDSLDLVAEIELMFSHVDNNLAGMQFPEHNFVFAGNFDEVLNSLIEVDPIRI
ncbi:MAG TPA: hypothetical protein PK402_09240 [Tepidisphaeraceae bacterium]|nr:hypothetical protein [Tepidisphaeraceae bacterium]